MNDLGKVMKFLLALSLGVGLAWSTLACSKQDKPAQEKPAEAPAAAAPSTPTPAPTTQAPQAGAARTIELKVTSDGYVPSPIKLKKDEPVVLQVTRVTDETCALDLIMPDYGINKPLPLHQKVEIAFTPTKTGTLKYGCAMDQMVSGVFLVE